MPFRAQIDPVSSAVAAGEADGWDRLLAFVPAASHLLWAAVALVLGLLCFSALRRFADREPLPAAMVPPLTFAAPPATSPEPPPAPESPAPRRMRDPVTAVRRAAERDPARVADALRGWIEG